jgi:hypothetical protein
MAQTTAMELCCLLKISPRLKNVVSGYLLSLALSAPKHTQDFASQVSGIDQSRFSRLLRNHPELAVESLQSLSQQITGEKAPGRKPLVSGAPWTIGVLVDATLHERSSRHVHNAQRFNHGEGFVIGHQWTNVVLTLGEDIIPLPPIPFLTRSECKRRGISYRTEHEQVITYLQELNLNAWVGLHDPSEVVVLMDSGYDNKRIQNTIVDLGWDFVGSLKSSRGAKSIHANSSSKILGFTKIRELFRLNRRYAPWENVRIESASTENKTRKKFRIRRIEGYLKGLMSPVALICSKKSRGKGNLFLACSNRSIGTRSILAAYTIRWRVELFHRDVKDKLGMLDAGVSHFESQRSHVHWVYCAYLLLKNQNDSRQTGRPPPITQCQKELTRRWEAERYREIIQISTRFDGARAVKNHCFQVLADLQSA